MTAAQLVALRERLRFTQATMANQMGLSLRAYSELENGGTIRQIHELAAERVAIEVAFTLRQPDMLPEWMNEIALERMLESFRPRDNGNDNLSQSFEAFKRADEAGKKEIWKAINANRTELHELIQKLVKCQSLPAQWA